MRKKLTSPKNYTPECRNCMRGKLSPDGTLIMCPKKGLTEPDYSCRAYKYDALKRCPKKAPVPEAADPADFEL